MIINYELKINNFINNNKSINNNIKNNIFNNKDFIKQELISYFNHILYKNLLINNIKLIDFIFLNNDLILKLKINKINNNNLDTILNKIEYELKNF